MPNLFDSLPIWLVFPVTLILALLFSELGYRVGKWWQKRTTNTKDPSLGALVGASLGLLAFLLAFVTGIAESRYDRRRALVLQDANSIGTTELRARYLDEPISTESRTLLREYVDTRLAPVNDPSQLAPSIARGEEIQNELWMYAQTLARREPNSETLGLYIDALNAMIDTHGERKAAVAARVPATLLTTIFLIGLLAMALVGFSNSYEGRRSGIGLFIFVLIFALVFTIIIDLDRPQEGLLRVSQQPMIDLQQQLKP